MHALWENLQQPEYVHVLLNHLPLTGLFAAWLCLIGTWLTRNRTGAVVALLVVSLFALSAWPTVVYGLRGFDRVLAMSGDAGAAWLKQHRELGEHWLWLYMVTAASGVVGLAASWKWPKVLWVAVVATLLLSLGSLVAGGVIAECGGKVRHPEFRNGPPPGEPPG